VLSSRPLVATADVAVAAVRCQGAGPAWSDPEPVGRFGLVLVRSGLFRRQVDGAETVVDTCAGYLQRPGSEQRIAHPLGGDVCTSFRIGAAALDAITGGAALPADRADGPIFTDPAADLGHWALLARARAGAGTDELTERAMLVIGTVLAGVVPHAVAAGFPGQRRSRRVVDQVRQAVATDPGVRLADLARATELSPYHLSRLFHRSSGMTIGQLRSRLKVRRVLGRLADGQRDLAALAAETGFADQAHLTRTVRRETGRTPGQLRALLSPRHASGDGEVGARAAVAGRGVPEVGSWL
jgi:AraC-like DNA-binding protein